jgi:hypothetical protein
MHAPDDNTASKGLREWWTSPPRSGMRLIIAPWEYRHLRAFAGARIGGGIVLASLGVPPLSVPRRYGDADAEVENECFAWTDEGECGHE